MQVAKAVIRDLLPVYLAGEASRETRALVEEFLAGDPELRALADAPRETDMTEAKPPSDFRTLEMRTLNRTRRLLAMKSFVLGIALLFTFLPLTTVFRDGETAMVLARDYPDAASGLLVHAGIAWLVFLVIRRRLSATALETPHTALSQLLSSLVGAALGLSSMLVAQHWTDEQKWPILLLPLFAGIGLLAGRYRGTRVH